MPVGGRRRVRHLLDAGQRRLSAETGVPGPPRLERRGAKSRTRAGTREGRRRSVAGEGARRHVPIPRGAGVTLPGPQSPEPKFEAAHSPLANTQTPQPTGKAPPGPHRVANTRSAPRPSDSDARLRVRGQQPPRPPTAGASAPAAAIAASAFSASQEQRGEGSASRDRAAPGVRAPPGRGPPP